MYLYTGTFFYQKPDFDFHDEFTQEEFESLSDCAEWVQMYAIGGYYVSR